MNQIVPMPDMDQPRLKVRRRAGKGQWTLGRGGLLVRQVFVLDVPDEGTWVWDVSRALAALRGAWREPTPWPAPALESLVSGLQADPSAVKSCDPSIPGVVAPRPTRAGYPEPVLIDGCHRAKRSLKDKTPFSAFRLTLAESLDCLLAWPHPPLAGQTEFVLPE